MIEAIVLYALRQRAVSYLITCILLFGGVISFFQLGQLEDPTFTVKTAVVMTRYPGASPHEVEWEVTDRLEKAVQEMPQLKELYSTSEAGLSVIKVDIQDQYWSDELPQVWDELRRKVGDASKDLPPGALDPEVFDDYGFVYGFVIAVSAEGYSDRDLEAIVDAMQKELSLVKGVTRIDLWGVQQQVIYVDMSEKKLHELGISGQTIVETLQSQNLVVDAGALEMGTRRLRIAPTGEFRSPEEIGELTIRPSSVDMVRAYFDEPLETQGESNHFLYLKDLVTIRRGIQEPITSRLRLDGKNAIGIALAGSDRENIVTVGQRLDTTLEQIMANLPAGVSVQKIAWQSDVVDQAVQSFLINLAQAVVIVLVVLVIPSGFRMGCIIGFDLILTILATFMYMAMQGIPLQRMSLGALIIALGMMVDNAIVISDNIAVKLRQGIEGTKACVEAVKSASYPLFASTVVAIMAFYPIVASKASSGEYTMSLFEVVGTSLFLSYFIAIFLTPVQCLDFLPRQEGVKPSDDEFDHPIFKAFRSLLQSVLRRRVLSMSVLLIMLVVSMGSFGFVTQMFFPDSSRNQLMIDYWAPYGTQIQHTTQAAHRLEQLFSKDPRVTQIAAFIGQGPPRFYLPIDPEGVRANYAQLIINLEDFRQIPDFIAEYEETTSQMFPESMVRYRKFGVGPSNTFKFEVRLSGPANTGMDELRSYATQVDQIVRKSPYGRDWMLDIQNPTLRVLPQYDQKRARLSYITREDLAQTLKRGYDGVRVGLYREQDKLLPIVVRNVEEERQEFADRMELLSVQPKSSSQNVPVSQAIRGITLDWENPVIVRSNRRRAVTVQGEPKEGETFPTLQQDVIEAIEKIELPKGYDLFWDAEAKSTRESQEALLPGVFPAVVVMIFMIVTVFNAYKPLCIIALTIPFAVIGITWGLLLLDTPFGFMALLGAMSLAGMMNKNIVVLLDAVFELQNQGLPPSEAVIQATVTRVRPVLLAAATTVLGVIPLVQDVFWTAMAVTIMSGLAFGSLLTLFVVPILYSLLYRVRYEPS